MDTLQQVQVQIINAFTDQDKGGNPAGVVLNADRFTNDQKLKIAQKMGLSETAFVSQSNSAAYKLDFFTPARQIAHCGHATIATFSYLAQQGKIKGSHSSKETIDGNRGILIEGELAFMEQRATQYIDLSAKKEIILASLGLAEYDLLPGAPISIVNTGNSFAIIPVAGKDILKNINPDLNLINQVSEEYDLIGYYIFCLETEDNERDVNTRMFAPRYGIAEEAGTGMAAGPLACYLYDMLGQKRNRFLIQQGWYMKEPSPSLIIVNLSLENNKITKVMAGGKGISVASVQIDL